MVQTKHPKQKKSLQMSILDSHELIFSDEKTRVFRRRKSEGQLYHSLPAVKDPYYYADFPQEMSSYMKSIQREEQEDYFAGMMQKIVKDWDPYIKSLKKKSLPLQPHELSKVPSTKEDLCIDLDWIYSLDKESLIKALILKLSRKLRYDC